MTDRHASLRFGIDTSTSETGKQRTSMYVDTPAEIFKRAKNELTPKALNIMVRSGAIKIANPRDSIARLFFNVTPLAGSYSKEPLPIKLRNVIRMINVLEKVTLPPEKDPNLRVRMGLRPKPDMVNTFFPMEAILNLPTDINAEAVSNSATSTMKEIAESAGFVPPSLAFGVRHAKGKPNAVLLGGMPVRGLQAQGWERSETGLNRALFTDRNLATYNHEAICLAGVIGIVQAVRDFQDR